MRLLALVLGLGWLALLESCGGCSVEGQYFVGGTVTGGNCPRVNSSLTITPAISGTGADYFVQIGGSLSGCFGKQTGPCAVDVDCSGAVSDAIDPNDNVARLHMSLVMSSGGFTGTASLSFPATPSFPGCAGTQELGGARD